MTDFDIAIIGGGPAGASAAIELARRSRRAVVFERGRFSRFAERVAPVHRIDGLRPVETA